MHTPSTKKCLSSNFGKVAKLFQIELELHLLQNDRGKYLKNTLIGYVNVNSSCDKTADFQIIIQSLPLDYVQIGWKFLECAIKSSWL